MKHYIKLFVGLALATSCGCLAVEKKELIAYVPPEPTQLELFYLFEGISVSKSADYDSAKKELNSLKTDTFSFFGPHFGEPPESFRFGDLCFYSDPSRKRNLCAHRRLTITDLPAVLDEANSAFSEMVKSETPDKTIARLKEGPEQFKQLESLLTQYKVEDIPLIKAGLPLTEMLWELDRSSIERIHQTANADFRWLRVESQTIKIVIPATADCARKIVEQPKWKTWKRDFQKFVSPFDFQATDEGLVITLGAPGKPIRFRTSDTRDYRVEHEGKLFEAAGSPAAIPVKENTDTADALIADFLEACERSQTTN